MFGVFRRQPEARSSDPAPMYANEPVVTADTYNRLLNFMRVYGRTQTLSRADKALIGRMQSLPVSWKNTLPPAGVFANPDMSPSRFAPLPIPGTAPSLPLGAYGLPGVSPLPAAMPATGLTMGASADVSAPDPAQGGLTW